MGSPYPKPAYKGAGRESDQEAGLGLPEQRDQCAELGSGQRIPRIPQGSGQSVWWSQKG